MGIIKSAFMGGVAVYGVKQIAKTAESRQHGSNNSQSITTVDPEYLEWLEWKKRSARTTTPSSNQYTYGQDHYVDEHANNVRRDRSVQQLYLTQPQHMPPYNHSSAQDGLQSLNFLPSHKSGAGGRDWRRGISGNRQGWEWKSMIDHGMDMLQARRGSDQIQKRRLGDV